MANYDTSSDNDFIIGAFTDDPMDLAAPRLAEGDNDFIIGVFTDESDASHAVDVLSGQGFDAAPIPSDRAKTYRPSLQPDEILVAVECGGECDRAKLALDDYGASSVVSPDPSSLAYVMGVGALAGAGLTQQDTEIFVDIDGEIDVKEGPYVEPDLTRPGGFGPR